MSMTENQALTAISDAAAMAVENADRAATRLRVLQRRLDAAWTARTPQQRTDAVEAVVAYFNDSVHAADCAQEILRRSVVLEAATLLASGQCAPEPA